MSPEAFAFTVIAVMQIIGFCITAYIAHCQGRSVSSPRMRIEFQGIGKKLRRR